MCKIFIYENNENTGKMIKSTFNKLCKLTTGLEQSKEQSIHPFLSNTHSLPLNLPKMADVGKNTELCGILICTIPILIPSSLVTLKNHLTTIIVIN